MKPDFRSVAIGDPASIRPAAERLKSIAQELAGLRVYTSIDLARSEPMVDANDKIIATDIFGWEKTLEKRWSKWTFGYDSAVYQVCRCENRPFWFNESLGIQGLVNRDHLRSIKFAGYEKEWEIKASIIIPVHLPFSQIGLASFSCMDNCRDDLSEEYQQYSVILQQLSLTFVSDYYSLLHHPIACTGGVILTAREVECLQWIGRGKTDKQTAAVMRCQVPTVRFHLHNAASKLGVGNRTEAVARAAQLGFLPGVDTYKRGWFADAAACG
ncbi:MAG: hypothetical protein JO127_11855 [Caulobacteraceae bacterium]|nr:hypothetical protein [Caulobacteraceae bacterium]